MNKEVCYLLKPTFAFQSVIRRDLLWQMSDGETSPLKYLQIVKLPIDMKFSLYEISHWFWLPDIWHPSGKHFQFKGELLQRSVWEVSHWHFIIIWYFVVSFIKCFLDFVFLCSWYVLVNLPQRKNRLLLEWQWVDVEYIRNFGWEVPDIMIFRPFVPELTQ